jgi:metal-responsive CopG/Arc/MetJ family transcriptional regulator
MMSFDFSIDETLLKDTDAVAGELSMTRSDFIRAALDFALRNQRMIQL